MKHPRILLLSLLAFVSFTVVPASFFILVRPAAGMPSLPLSVLSYNLFKKLFVLSSFFSIAVTGISLITFIYVLKHKINANLWCYLTSLVLLAWMATDVTLIGQFNWLQLVYFITAILILLLADIHEHYKRPFYK